MMLTNHIRQRPLTTFFVGTVALGWVLTVLSTQLPSSAILLPLVAIPVSYVPAVLAYVVLRVAGSDDERRALRRRLTTFRVGWVWYAVALLLLPMVHLVAVGLATLAGGSVSVEPALITLLPLFLVTNLGEEIGWRGYALPKLQERMSTLGAALIVGLVWAVFHWVALLGNPETPWAYVAVSTAHLTAVSVIMAFVFNRARESLPVLVLVHATYDTMSIGVVPLIGTGVPLLVFGLSAVVAWVVVGVLVLRYGADLGRDRGPREAVATAGSPVRATADRERRAMRSPRGVAAAAVMLGAIPVAIIANIAVDGSAELMIHLAIGAGSVLLASAMSDFRVPRWLDRIGVLAAAAFGAIFLLQATSQLIPVEALRILAFEVLGQGIERVLPYVVVVWFVGLLVSDSVGLTRLVGIAVMSIVVGAAVVDIVGPAIGLDAGLAKVLFLLQFVWLLLESAKPRSSSAPAPRRVHEVARRPVS